MRDLSQLTAVIKTFQRPAALRTLIRSIRRYYPQLAISVADDGFVPTPRNDVDYVRLPTDVGLSAGRNALLRHIRTPYFLLLDDDLEFTKQTRIERLLELVESGAVDIAAGDYYRCKRRFFLTFSKWQPYHGTFKFENGELLLVRKAHAILPNHERHDIVHNFFVARTAEVLAMGGWDEELKLNEHVEFFVRAKKIGMRVAYCGDVIARHWSARDANYMVYRERNFTELAAQKIGVRQVRKVLEGWDKKAAA